MIARILFFYVFIFLLVGCGGRSIQQTPAAGPERLVRVDWYGHQCFRIKSSLGLSILTNPFSPGSTDFNQPKNLTPEIILISTESADANYVDMVDNTPHILRSSVGAGTNTASGLRILGVPIFKNPEVQDVTGMNVMYRWSMDGLKFGFLGDLDVPPTSQDLARFGHVDVLFMPVTGSDLNTVQRQSIIAELHPQVIIPMGTLDAVNRFALGYTSVYRLQGTAALLSRDALPATRTVLLFRSP